MKTAKTPWASHHPWPPGLPKPQEANVPGCSASPDAVEQAGSASEAYLGSAMPEQRRTQHCPPACLREHNQAKDVTRVSGQKLGLARMTTSGDDCHTSPLGCDRLTHIEISVCANNGEDIQVLNGQQKALWTKTCCDTLNLRARAGLYVSALQRKM